MKIAVWHNLPSGGGKRALYDQIEGLVARGHHIKAWCPPTADQTYLPLGGIIPEQVVPLGKPIRSNWEARLRIPARMERRIAAMDEHCQRCAAVIESEDFEILLAAPCLLFRVTAIGRFVKLPKILYLQEPFRALYEAQPRLPWLAPLPSQLPLLSLARVREAALIRRTLHNVRIQGREELLNAAAFDRILVNSLFSRESILRAYGLDSEVCYLGANLSRFIDRGLPRERVIVGLGTYTPEKNLRLVIEALALLPTPRPELHWVGNAAYGDTLQEMSALAESRGVPFTPHLAIPDDELVTLLNRASAMVYAPRLEPFGLAPIEAGACGLPVVAVAEGGVRETVIDNETGFLVQNRPRDVADAVLRLLRDPTLVRRLGAAARMNAERRWSQSAAVDRIEQALCRFAVMPIRSGATLATTSPVSI
jgi:glycosyltransferase involved in cell wall biosynthesis